MSSSRPPTPEMSTLPSAPVDGADEPMLQYDWPRASAAACGVHSPSAPMADPSASAGAQNTPT